MIRTSTIDMILLYLKHFRQNKHKTFVIVCDAVSILLMPVKVENSFGLHDGTCLVMMVHRKGEVSIHRITAAEKQYQHRNTAKPHVPLGEHVASVYLVFSA